MVISMHKGVEKPSALLSVRDLSVDTHIDHTEVGSPILDEISLDIGAGQAVGLTGQSGSGKSTILRSILGMVRSDYTKTGSIRFDGSDIMTEGNVDQSAISGIRGSSLAFVWQNPKDMLHPMHKSLRAITEHLRIHENITKAQAIERASEALHRAGVKDPAELLSKYPHELSGGQAQRVCLAQALVTRPKLLLTDEVLSSLDPATSADVIAALSRLVENGLSLLFVSHDIGVLADLCESTAVIHEGKRVEYGPTERVLTSPTHHHTKALVEADHRLGGRA